ncbi:MAG: PaaX family transcriptional regulator [Pseudonocardiaceae bacterium]|nr:PaaX family transcriptional regulator [Pseudonocardiaceae bacterium]
MKPRSIVFDLFGDHLRYRGGAVRLRGLSELMACFDVPEATVRVVMARLRREGWFETRREGRETVYALSDAGWRLLDEGRSRIFDRAREPWDGQWHMVIYSVPEAERALREQLRKRLAWFGFGPLAASTWLSPHDRLDQVRDSFAEQDAVRLDVLRARSEGVDTDRAMAQRCWDLAGLQADYTRWIGAVRRRMPVYRRAGGRDALVERMRLVHDYRRFPFRDPDLPLELLPDGWSGRQAHELFLEAHELLREPAEKCVTFLTDDLRTAQTGAR